MSLIGVLQTRTGRLLLASLALVANLVATGIPVLHAWAHAVADAHHGAETHHPALAEAGAIGHSHDEVHPAALHGDSLLVHRTVFDLSLALPAPPVEIERSATGTLLPFHPVAPMSSRAPPSPGQARAPPLA